MIQLPGNPSGEVDPTWTLLLFGLLALGLVAVMAVLAFQFRRRRDRPRRTQGVGLYVNGVRQDDAQLYGWAGTKPPAREPMDADLAADAAMLGAIEGRRHRAESRQADVGADGAADIPIK